MSWRVADRWLIASYNRCITIVVDLVLAVVAVAAAFAFVLAFV